MWPNAPGCRAATASRSLRGLAKVSPDTRQRVIEAARELSYTTAPQAAPEFAPGPRKTVAVIVPFITRWFFTTVTAAAVDHLREHGLRRDALSPWQRRRP